MWVSSKQCTEGQDILYLANQVTWSKPKSNMLFRSYDTRDKILYPDSNEG